MNSEKNYIYFSIQLEIKRLSNMVEHIDSKENKSEKDISDLFNLNNRLSLLKKRLLTIMG